MIRAIDEKSCIGCGACVVVCPGDVIEIADNKKAKIQDPQDCWTCFNCEMTCPMKAIDVHPFRKVKPMAW